MSAIENIDRSVAELADVTERYLCRDTAAALNIEYQEKKRESRLPVMLYGSYNAGKSSLINALVGSEVAAIADVPKTSVIAKYEWNDCFLIDTPGVNAPIEHEEITKDQIKRSELILFVIREGDQDVAEVYQRMFELLAIGKQLFIVYNHELAAENLPESLARLDEILVRYASEFNLPVEQVAKVPIIPVNARTALKAKTKRSEGLLQSSGITALETTFKLWLSGFACESHYRDALQKHVLQCFVEPLLEKLPGNLDSPEFAMLRDLQQQREGFVNDFDLLAVQIVNHVRSQVSKAKPDIQKAIVESNSQVEFDAQVNELAERVTDSTSELMQEKCESISERLEHVFGKSYALPSDSEQGSKRADAFRSAAGQGIESAAGRMKNIDADSIKNVLLKLRKWKIPKIKGRWESTLGTWSQTIGKWVKGAGWVLTFATAAYDIYSASKAEDQLNEEQRQIKLGVYQLVEGIARDITSSITEPALAVIKEAETAVIVELDSAIQPLLADQDQSQQDRELVKRVSLALQTVPAL